MKEAFREIVVKLKDSKRRAYNKMIINYSKQAIKFLSKQDKPVRIRIIEVISRLPQGDVKKLQGQEGYRLWVGDYRVIFNRNGDILYIEKSIIVDRSINEEEYHECC